LGQGNESWVIMAIRATLLAAALCVSLVVAQPPSFMQMADGSHGVVDRAVLGDGYTQVVGYPGPQSAAIDQSVVHSYGTIRRDRDGGSGGRLAFGSAAGG